MVKRGRRAAVTLGIAAAVAALWTAHSGILSLENVRQNADLLHAAVDRSYLASAAIFILLYLMTALFLPGALVLTVVGGFLFGVVPATLYISAAATTGAYAAFAAVRRVAGANLQQRYAPHLQVFNRELERHGASYLLVLRIVPVFPFFIVNVLAGLTRLRTSVFILTTFFGIIPGALVFTYAGLRLRDIRSLEDLFSAETTAVFIALAAMALLPVLLSRLRLRSRR